MRIAICDDEAAQREYLAQLAGQWGEQRGEKVSLSLFQTAKAFFFGGKRNRDLICFSWILKWQR